MARGMTLPYPNILLINAKITPFPDHDHQYQKQDDLEVRDQKFGIKEHAYGGERTGC